MKINLQKARNIANTFCILDNVYAVNDNSEFQKKPKKPFQKDIF